MSRRRATPSACPALPSEAWDERLLAVLRRVMSDKVHSLSLRDLAVLLSCGTAIGVGKIGESLGTPRVYVSRSADLLVAQGLLRRYHPDADRRIVLLERTPEGNDLLAAIVQDAAPK